MCVCVCECVFICNVFSVLPLRKYIIEQGATCFQDEDEFMVSNHFLSCLIVTGMSYFFKTISQHDDCHNFS